MLNIEYKTDTQDDMADMLSSLLMVRSTAFLAKNFVERLKLEEGYYELLEAFDNIKMLLEPALSYIESEMMGRPKKQRVKHSA